MRWFRITKEVTTKPTTGKYYWDWKEHLSTEGKEQCVYCAININTFGGIRNFHVEHYKPKSLPQFATLEHDFLNLFFACSICNCFKSNDWPNDPSDEFDNHSYPDPSKHDYSSFLELDAQHNITSTYPSGKYIIHKLFLNRPQLVLERKAHSLHESLKIESQKLVEIVQKIKNADSTNPLVDGLITMIETTILLIDEKYINPYTIAQVTR